MNNFEMCKQTFQLEHMYKPSFELMNLTNFIKTSQNFVKSIKNKYATMYLVLTIRLHILNYLYS